MFTTACRDAPSENAELAQYTEPSAKQFATMAVTDVNFMADDGLTVSGKYYRADKSKALILLFHQANSSMAEYETIAPRLVEMGYSALAIDQRSGGTMFGENLTAARIKAPVTYDNALHDLDAALRWSRTMNVPTIVWGSSYSSALAFQLAAKHPSEISAVLAFSPGEYIGPGQPVAKAAARVKVPVFVAVGSDVSEIRDAQPIFDAIASKDKTLFAPKQGVHGSSTLIADRNEKGARQSWIAVARFLKNVDQSLGYSQADRD